MVGEAKGEGRSGYMRALCTFLLNFFVNLKWYKMKSINFSKIKIIKKLGTLYSTNTFLLQTYLF